MLFGWFYIFIHTLHWSGDNEREGKTGRRGGNGVKHKERSFEKAPGLSRGRGRAASTTLPSVQQTDGERERARESGGEWRLGEDGRDGEGAAIQHIDLMSVLALFLKWSWEDDGNIYTQCTTRLDSRSLHSQVFSHQKLIYSTWRFFIL